jgi:hypothetical protein
MTNEPARQPDGGGEYLRGGPGEPTLLVTDHVSDREARYRQQLREVQDREIKDLLAKVERTAVERRFAPPPSPAEVALEQARGQAWIAKVKDGWEEPARLDQQQAELEAWALEAELARPPEKPQPTRYGKALSPAEQAHERALDAEFEARNRAAAKAVCTSCRVVGGDCGAHGP